MSFMEPSQLIQIYLPLYDAQGNSFSEVDYEAVKIKLTEKFGGITMYTRSPATGLWKEDQDKTVKDDIIIYEVVAEGLDQNFWSNYKNELKDKFKQDELLIRCSAITII
jgi:hypothetical protein